MKIKKDIWNHVHRNRNNKKKITSYYSKLPIPINKIVTNRKRKGQELFCCMIEPLDI